MPKYDVVLSFAGQDRQHAKDLVDLLERGGYSFFYDENERAHLWGKDLYVHLSWVYKDHGRYCVMFLSEHYARNLWTNHERENAQARAFQENSEYILPVRLDDTEIPGILPTVGYLDLRSMTIEEIYEDLVKKLSETIATDNEDSLQSEVGGEESFEKEPDQSTDTKFSNEFTEVKNGSRIKRENQEMKYVFISYMHENTDIVDRLCKELTSCGIKVWLDRNDIKPGAPWKDAIRDAIRDGTFFIACFSKEYNQRDKTYMNEELTIAIEELRQRPTDQIWFIPVKLNRCKIPDRNIGGGETLNDLQHVKLYKDWDAGIQHIVKVIQPESHDPTIDEDISEKEIDRNARLEYAKGLACQNSVTETTPPEERQEKIQKAFYHYSKALEIEPNYVDARNARGGSYIFMDKPEDAIQDLNMALKLDPSYFVAYWNRGNIYMNKRMYEQAINDFNKVIELKPEFFSVYLNRALAYRYVGSFEKAIKDYNTSIKLNPDNAELYKDRGVTYGMKGEFMRAIKNYTKAIKLDPGCVLAYYNRGIHELRLQNWSAAKSDLLTAKNMNMDIITAFRNQYESTTGFEQKIGVQLPPDIAALLTHQ